MKTGNKGKAITTKKTFSRETSVTIDIVANTSVVWSLLTNSSNYPTWNSTIISITGEIEKGRKVKLKSKLSPERTFILSIKEFKPESKLVWGDAMGNRIFELNATGSVTTFSMHEKIGGPLFPFFAGMIPSFDESFEHFATDLKTESERISNSKK